MHDSHHEPRPTTPDTERQHEAEPSPRPAIYVASLADYVNGRLHGVWLDAARNPDDIHADIAAMLARSPEPGAEEFAMHDYDQFGHWRVGEYDSIEQISRIARGIAEHGYAYAAWVETLDGDLDDIDPDSEADAFNEDYLGHYGSVTDYAEQMADDLGYIAELAKLPEYVQQYTHIDYAAIACDLEASGDIATITNPDGGVWIFNANS
ncbi:Antirestriction ArdA family protein [Gordonia bronchialis DSM 43247]|uniref:Antirestriction ArdA family protein n=1 Tax=Gordonia bronchialis (strain ATCC 25592 / DSM 43247 / BCRC 13721 / JCM 3198 / KCTC 3076 / NBRC 16047 / NCTC 10667) TaxID=526226 RepID=D0L6F7_GORB4|nr:antirestriction protein ArdA [Gordonia bronchialis]ACY20714.1 Antirestriction ArdA family protein [Gordonia bronchialis DSM 43247]MCC3323487.1 antirestriction protein ArdA [Gordonia bronchialis]QGS25535.1 antirestriction protein ArdA [Gordonia bronchialis]STQ63543.1 Antirestriction protein [Gordonia bronchialis]